MYDSAMLCGIVIDMHGVLRSMFRLVSCMIKLAFTYSDLSIPYLDTSKLYALRVIYYPFLDAITGDYSHKPICM